MLKTRRAQIIAFLIVLALVITGAIYVKNGGFSNKTRIGSKSVNSASDDSVYELVTSAANPVPTHQSISNFSEWIKTTDKPILVDFWAVWCGPCRAAAPFIESLAFEFAGRAHIVKIDVDQESALAKEYKATSIPLFVIIKNGKVVESMAGYVSSRDDQIRKALNNQTVK